jgi:hypothetical protein
MVNGYWLCMLDFLYVKIGYVLLFTPIIHSELPLQVNSHGITCFLVM